MRKRNKKRKIKLNRRRIIVLLVLALILFLIIFGIINLFKLLFSKEEVAGNLANMGLVVEGKNAVYYNKYEEGIIKVRKGEETKITDETAYSMTLIDDTIYYLTVSSSNTIDLKSVKTTGDDLKKIKTLQTIISKFYIENNFVYYIENGEKYGIAKYSLETDQNTILSEEKVQDFVLVEDTIYYTNESGYLYAININSREKHEISTNYNIKKIQVLNKWIYFYDETQNALCKIKKDGSKEKVVATFVNNEWYNVTSKRVYYYDAVNKQICACDLKGKKSKPIVAVTALKPRINIANGEMYYLDTSKNTDQMYQIFRVKEDGSVANSIDY